MCLRTMAAAALLPLLAAAGCQRQSAPAADVWAVVNGQEIHRDEVQKYYNSRLNPQTQSPSQDEALSLTLNIVDELINNDILIQRAKKLGLEATDGEVEDKFTEFKSPYTEEEFQQQLKDRGVSVDDLKRDIRRELSVQKLINREVVAKISISDQDVSNFYNENRAQFNVAETQYRLAQIVVTPHKDAQVRNRKNDDATTARPRPSARDSLRELILIRWPWTIPRILPRRPRAATSDLFPSLRSTKAIPPLKKR